MHIVINKSRPKNSRLTYQSILLMESYREDGKVKKRTIANLTKCNPKEIEAIRIALKHKGDLAVLGSLKEDLTIEEGKSVGAVYVAYEVAKRIGIEEALGKDHNGKMALWQVIGRLIGQGSRLKAVRMAQSHAVSEILGMQRGFDENDLYENLKWIAERQGEIEERLYRHRAKGRRPELFLYDVTSSYLEGEMNYFGEYGYNRDGKKGKKQIVIGLLCDEGGNPLSTEVYAGNTRDMETFYEQIKKARERFKCERVTFVGDRGMIKRAQIEALSEGFHYITAISKPEIEKMIREGIIQLELFEDEICEVEEGAKRYIMRRNPRRAEEIRESRRAKVKHIEELLEKWKKYLEEHKRAKVETVRRRLQERIKKLKIDKWAKVEVEGRGLRVVIDEDSLAKESLLDGCYVIKTDLSKAVADKEVVHDRYKDLAEVERAFREMKTGLLEVRPVFVRREKSTRGHVIVVMLAYMISKALREAWKGHNLTVEEGIRELSTLCSMKVTIKNQVPFHKIPLPRLQTKELLESLGINMPTSLAHKELPVVTRKKLQIKRE